MTKSMCALVVLMGTLSPSALAQDAVTGTPSSDVSPEESSEEALATAQPILPPDPSAFGDSDRSNGSQSNGSLWNEVEARDMIGLDGNARRLGDLVTVNISEETATEIQADTSTSRSSEVSGGIGTLLGIGKGATGANANLNGELGMSVNQGSDFTGDGSTRRAEKFVGSLTCQVVEVLPNKNLVIEGWKQVRVNRETQALVLRAIVRPRDIQADNTIDSRYLAQAEIEFSGSGVIADKQGPGLGTRVVDHVWPF